MIARGDPHPSILLTVVKAERAMVAVAVLLYDTVR